MYYRDLFDDENIRVLDEWSRIDYIKVEIDPEEIRAITKKAVLFGDKWVPKSVIGIDASEDIYMREWWYFNKYLG